MLGYVQTGHSSSSGPKHKVTAVLKAEESVNHNASWSEEFRTALFPSDSEGSDKVVLIRRANS